MMTALTTVTAKISRITFIVHIFFLILATETLQLYAITENNTSFCYNLMHNYKKKLQTLLYLAKEALID